MSETEVHLEETAVAPRPRVRRARKTHQEVPASEVKIQSLSKGAITLGGGRKLVRAAVTTVPEKLGRLLEERGLVKILK